MTVAALSGQSLKPLAPPVRVVRSRTLATLLRTILLGHNLYLEACLVLWGVLALLTTGAQYRLDTIRSRVSRLWTAFRLGAGVTWLCLQPGFAELCDSRAGWAAFSAAAGALFIRVSTPDSADARREWDRVLGTPLYPGDRPVRAAIYRRVSTLEQEEEGHSLDEQLVRAKRYVEDNGWVLVEVYTDVYSGKSGGRPALHRLEKAVVAGEVDVVVIDRIDRLYRNLLGLLRMVKLLNEHGVALVSVSERVGFDTPWGRLVLNVLGALAEYYLAALSVDTQKGKHARARIGLANGAYRLGVCSGLCGECSDPNGRGYCPYYGGENRGNGRVPVHHPIEAQAVQWMYRWYATGAMSYEDIAHRLNARLYTLPDGRQVPYRSKGMPGRSEPGPFTDDAVRYILSNPFYKGYVGYGGLKAGGQKERKPVELFEGQHEPLVDEETWNRCQEIRRQRRHRPDGITSPARTYPLSRLLFCSRCKGSMRGFSSNGAQNRYYGDHLFREKWRGERAKGKEEEELEANLSLAYDHQLNVGAEAAEEQVAAVVGRIELPTEWKRLILAYISEDGGLSAYDRKKLEVHERLRRANERYLSPVAPISRWELERIEGECLAELARLERMLPPGTEEPDVWQYLDDLGRLWAAATWEEQNRLLSQLCSAIFVEDQNVVKLVTYPAFHGLLAEAAGRAAEGAGEERGAVSR
jgi:DNA invertase Pin-like site-specific DNA recombinase